MSINLKISKSNKKLQSQLENQISQIDKKEDQINTIQSDQRFFNIENYIVFGTKQKVKQNFISKDEYFQCLSLISKAFKFNFEAFLSQNALKWPEKQCKAVSSISKNHGLQQILSHNQVSDFMSSYGGFTRKTNKVVFLLINRNKNSIKMNSKQQRQLRCSFLNQQGKILHIMSNLQQNSIPKLNKVLCKHFKNLSYLLILDFDCDVQQANDVIKKINELNVSKFIKKIIFISPLASKLGKPSIQVPFESQCNHLTSNKSNRQKQDSISYCFILNQQDSDLKDLQKQVVRVLNFKKIHDFVHSQFYKEEEFNQQTLFINKWINNVFAWYFNIVLNLRKEIPIRSIHLETKKEIDDKITKIFLELINQSKSNQINYNIQNNCYPDSMKSSKKCIVCKSCKPRYGCLKCSKRFKLEIYLCVENCFKLFHKDFPKYISKKFKSNNREKGPDKQKTNIKVQQKSLESVQINKHQDKELKERCPTQINYCKCKDPIARYKLIKKKAKIYELKIKQIPCTMISGMKVYSFLDMDRMEPQDQIDRQTHSLGHYKLTKTDEQSRSTDSPRK